MVFEFQYQAPTAPPLDDLQAVLAGLVGAPVRLHASEWSGDPYNGYSRHWTLDAGGPAVPGAASARFIQMGQWEDDSRYPGHESLRFTWSGASPADVLVVWHRLTAALHSLGYVDVTLLQHSRSIVAALRAAGLSAQVEEVRRQTTAAWVQEVPRHASVNLGSAEISDLDVVLAAYTRPEAKVTVSLIDVGLTQLPKGLDRFHAIQSLFLDDNPLPDGVLQRVHQPTVELLSLCRTAITHLEPLDLAGFPGLRILALDGTGLVGLSPEIRKVCPELQRLRIRDTPFARRPALLAPWKDDWPTVTIDG